MKKVFLVRLRGGNFLGKEGPTEYASEILAFHNEAIAQAAALHHIGAEVISGRVSSAYVEEELCASDEFMKSNSIAWA